MYKMVPKTLSYLSCRTCIKWFTRCQLTSRSSISFFWCLSMASMSLIWSARFSFWSRTRFMSRPTVSKWFRLHDMRLFVSCVYAGIVTIHKAFQQKIPSTFPMFVFLCQKKFYLFCSKWKIGNFSELLILSKLQILLCLTFMCLLMTDYTWLNIVSTWVV